MQTQKECKNRQDSVGTSLYWKLCKNVRFERVKKCHYLKTIGCPRERMLYFGVLTSKLLTTSKRDLLVINMKKNLLICVYKRKQNTSKGTSPRVE